jgi:hypothetical protein
MHPAVRQELKKLARDPLFWVWTTITTFACATLYGVTASLAGWLQ